MKSVTTVQRRPRRYLRSRITRKLILDTAMQIFLLEGYTKTTIARISEQANVGYGTVYSHFKGKDDILNRILDHVLSDLYNLLGSQPELSRPREYYNFFQKVMQTLFLLVEEHRPIMNVYGEALVHSEDIAAYWEELLQKFTDYIESYLDLARRNNFTRNVNTRKSARAYALLLDRYTWEIVKEKESKPEELAQNLTSIFFYGIFKSQPTA